DIRLRAPRRERRDPESLERDAVGEVERADLRPDLQSNQIARNRRREVQPDAELLEDDRHGVVARAALHDWNRELTTGEEAGFLAVVGNEVRLGQTLEPATLFERLDDAPDAFLLVEEEQIQEIAERRKAWSCVVEDRRCELL